MRCLGIESSCDETAAAVVTGEREILSSEVFDQADLHAPFGGVVPEIAARAHAERLDVVIAKALSTANTTLSQIDLISVTAGPGLIGGVLSGVLSAKAISLSAAIPFVGVNHLAGHALTPRLTDNVEYPYLMLLVSGGHCQFLSVGGPTQFSRIGGTIDDAPGEAFDKVAKMLGLGYPGGPEVDRLARKGNAQRFSLPRPLLDRAGCGMSFSGLKTAVRRARDQLVEANGGLTERDQADLAASFQMAVADVLAEKTRRAWQVFTERNGKGKVIAVAGGVAANSLVRERFAGLTEALGAQLLAPPLELCSDNAAMIAWAGIELFEQRGEDALDLAARPRWPLDENAARLLGSGKKGPKA